MVKAFGIVAAAGLIAFGISAQAQTDTDQLRQLAAQLFEPIPQQITELRGEPLNAEQVELGRMLFFEPRLSRSHIITCHTCHSLATGGADNVPASLGHGWQRGPRNSPTVLNAVFNIAQFWDGRASDLAEQAKGPVEAMVEMNNTPERVIATLSSIPEYVERFKRAYPDQKDPLTYDAVTRAIEAFEVTLITPNSRFDQFLTGDDTAMSELELEGLQLFINTGCAVCHGGRNLGGQSYFPFGVVERPGAEILPEDDKGRFEVTQTVSDEYVFRASPLRNIELTSPYFHSGQVWDLEQAVAIMGVSQLGREITEDQVVAITAFLRTLTGEQPQITIPVLPPSTSETPRPER